MEQVQGMHVITPGCHSHVCSTINVNCLPLDRLSDKGRASGR